VLALKPARPRASVFAAPELGVSMAQVAEKPWHSMVRIKTGRLSR
jgi:hypothetical protein